MSMKMNLPRPERRRMKRAMNKGLQKAQQKGIRICRNCGGASGNLVEVSPGVYEHPETALPKGTVEQRVKQLGIWLPGDGPGLVPR